MKVDGEGELKGRWLGEMRGYFDIDIYGCFYGVYFGFYGGEVVFGIYCVREN